MSEEQANPKSNLLLPVLAAALNGNELAHGRFEDCKVAMWDYANPEHFNSLWKSLEDGSVKDTSRVLIVWTKTLTDESLVPVNTVDHVSPVHWAACAAKGAEDNARRLMLEEKAKVVANTSEETRIQVEAEAKTPPLQVCVLDLNPTAHRSQYLYKYYLSCDKSRLTWLRVVQAAHFFGEQNSSGEFQPDANPVDIKTIEGRFFPILQFSAEKLVIEPASFCDHIREKLTSPSSPDDRHAITNIVGPIVLLSGKEITNEFPGGSYYVEGRAGKSYLPKRDAAALNPGAATAEMVSAEHRPALTGVFRAVELLPELPVQGEDAMQKRKEWEETEAKLKEQITTVLSSLPVGKKLRVTLVDDQWHHGWFEWLKSIFPEKTVFTICPDPEFLLKKLHAAKDRDADLRFEFDLSPPGENADGQYADMLLLDLRLFSGNSANESDFYRRLLPLCRKYEVSESGSLVPVDRLVADGALSRIRNLAWPGFSTAELKSAEAWIAGGDSGGQTKANHDVCLTLLVRLIALTDLSLPITIFSSTGQRSLVETFESYSNVITAFQKPHFFSHRRGNNFQSTYDKLITTLQQTLFWNDVRNKCRELLMLREKTSQLFHSKTKLNHQGKLYIELFVDEDKRSDVKDFAVGGVFAVFHNLEDADIFDDIAVENGLRYFDGEPLPPPQNRILSKYGDSASVELQAALNVFRGSMKQVSLGFVQLRRGAIKGIPELTQDEQDSRYFWMLLSLIELFIAESIPAIAEQNNIDSSHVSFSVYVGTRMVGTIDTGDFSFQRNIEIHHFYDGPKLRTLGGEAIYPAITECLRRHGLFKAPVLRALGVSLPYKEGPKVRCDRVIDRTQRRVFRYSPNKTSAVLVKLGQLSFGEIINKNDLRGFGFIRVLGLSENVFFHQTNCVEFNKLLPGTPVSLRVEREQKPDGSDGYNAYEVCAASQNDYAEWMRSLHMHLRPDFRALHYVADQVMRLGVGGYSLSGKLAGQFDEDCEEISAALEASRSLDLSDLSAAIRCYGFGLPAQRKYERPLARVIIGRRIARLLATCSGEQVAQARSETLSKTLHDHRNLLVGIEVSRQPTLKLETPSAAGAPPTEQLTPAVSSASQGKWIQLYSVKRTLDVVTLRNILQRHGGQKLAVRKVEEVGDHSEFRDVQFHFSSDCNNQIDKLAISLGGSGFKVTVAAS